MSAQLIYGTTDVAKKFGVTRSTVSNWLARYSDTPAPAYVTTAGYAYWKAEGMRQWEQWHNGQEK